MPLTLIIEQQLSNSLRCPILTLSMGGTLSGSSFGDAQAPSSVGTVSLEEATSGKYRTMFMHPESASTDHGLKIIRQLANKDMICALAIDEIHQVINSYWRYRNFLSGLGWPLG